MDEIPRWKRIMSQPVPPDEIEWRGQGKAYRKGDRWFASYVPYMKRSFASTRLREAFVTFSLTIKAMEQKGNSIVGMLHFEGMTDEGHIVVVEDIGTCDISSSSPSDAWKGAHSDGLKRITSLLGANSIYYMGRTVVPVTVYERDVGKDGKASRYYLTDEGRKTLERLARRPPHTPSLTS